MLSNFSPPGMIADYWEALIGNTMSVRTSCLWNTRRGPWRATHDLRSSHRHEANLAFSWIVPENKTDDWGYPSTSIKTGKDPDLLSSLRPELRSYKAKKNTKKKYNNKITVQYIGKSHAHTHPPMRTAYKLPLEKPLGLTCSLHVCSLNNYHA